MTNVLEKIKSVDYDNVTTEILNNIILDIIKLNDSEVVDLLLSILDDCSVSNELNSKEIFYKNIMNDKRLLGFKKDLEKQIYK